MTPDIFARRREELMKRMGKNAVAVFRAPPERVRTGDSVYAYRQSSDLFYLTGLVEPGSALILRTGGPSDPGPTPPAPMVLFVRPRDPERETWDGRRVGTEGAVARFGASVAHPIEELPAKLPELLANADDLYFSLGVDPTFDTTVCAAIFQLRAAERKLGRPPKRVVDPRTVLHEMRLVKSPEEVDALTRAAAITERAFVEAMGRVRPGMYEYELEAVIEYNFRGQGAAGPGYPTIVGAGDNATILHYVENEARIEAGHLVLIDAGAEFQYYTADVTRTFPAGGRFSAPQRRVYEAVLAAQKAAVALVRPGVSLETIHRRVVEMLTQSAIDLGLLQGSVAELVDTEAYKKYYMHRTSHWLGMDVHDVGAYLADDGSARPLVAGMVLTVEPGLYISAQDQAAPAELRGIGVRIEDDVLVTENGCRNLTVGIPKDVEAIERLCQDAARQRKTA